MPNKKPRKPNKLKPPSLSLSPSSPPPQPVMDPQDSPPATRKPATVPKPKTKPKPKPKTKPISKKKQALIDQKLSLLSQNLRLFPQISQTLTLDSHVPLLRHLNLLDFAAIRLDSHVRVDLLSELIAHYDPPYRRSLVLGFRIQLSRADLARALHLSPKRSIPDKDFDASLFGGVDEVNSVLSEFIANKVVFLEDAAILPEEVVTANRLVREGQPNKVDWAGLMWALVEKEVKEAPEKGSCYYAAHLQCLMKSQKPQLFEEGAAEGEVSEAVTDLTVDEEEVEGDVEVDGDAGSDEKCGPGLRLGIGGDGEESKEGEKEEDVKKGGDGNEGGRVGEEGVGNGDGVVEEKLPCLDRLASLDFMEVMVENSEESKKDSGEMKEIEGVTKGDGNEGERVGDEVVAEKFACLDRLASSDFIQVMEENNNGIEFGIGQSNEGFLGMGNDMVEDKGMGMGSGQGFSFLIGSEQKRGIDEMDEQINGFDHGHQEKRFRSEQPWEQSLTVAEFDGCGEHVQHWMGKIRMDLVEKERSYMNAQVDIDYLKGVVQQKDDYIESIEKVRMEELRRRQAEVCRFEHDLSTIKSVLFGVKKALKDTQNSFTEYRKIFPLVDETLLSKEFRQITTKMTHDFEKCWINKFGEHATWVSNTATKLVELHAEFKLLKERFTNAKGRNDD